MDFNFEATREELDRFEKDVSDVSPLLETYLQVIAKTGNTLFPWNKLQPLLRKKIELVLGEFTKTCPPDTIPTLPNTEIFDYDVMKTNLLNAVDNFPNAPFTIQRLCELVVNPKKHYSRTDKYMRGLEKNLLVVSTIESIANEFSSRGHMHIVNGNDSGSADGSSYDDEMNRRGQGNVPMSPNPPANGLKTVLENFATVFPSATRIAPPPPSNIQVPVISDSNDFLNTECVDDFNYEISDTVSGTPEGHLNEEMMTDSVMDETSLNSNNIETSEESSQSSCNSDVMGDTITDDINSEKSQSSVDEDISLPALPSENNNTATSQLDRTVNTDIAEVKMDISITESTVDTVSESTADESVVDTINESTGDIVDVSSADTTLVNVTTNETERVIDNPDDSTEDQIIHDKLILSENELSRSPDDNCGEPLPKRVKLDTFEIEEFKEQIFEPAGDNNSSSDKEKEQEESLKEELSETKQDETKDDAQNLNVVEIEGVESIVIQNSEEKSSENVVSSSNNSMGDSIDVMDSSSGIETA